MKDFKFVPSDFKTVNDAIYDLRPQCASSLANAKLEGKVVVDKDAWDGAIKFIIEYKEDYLAVYGAKSPRIKAWLSKHSGEEK